MASPKYDNEFIQDLLAWSKDRIETQNYPLDKFRLNECSTVADCKYYLESMVAVISKNRENPIFYPAIEQLQQFREKYKMEQEKEGAMQKSEGLISE